MNKPMSNIKPARTPQGQEHWTEKGDVKLFMWEKRSAVP